jgi:hypothetical protein
MQLIATAAMPSTVLYERMAANLIASWARYAEGATDAAVEHLPGVSAGVFPVSPERAGYNNALLERGLPARAIA